MEATIAEKVEKIKTLTLLYRINQSFSSRAFNVLQRFRFNENSKLGYGMARDNVASTIHKIYP